MSNLVEYILIHVLAEILVYFSDKVRITLQ